MEVCNRPMRLEMEAVEVDISALLKAHHLWLVNGAHGKRAEVSGATLNDVDFRPGPWDRGIFDRSALIESNFTSCSLVGASFVQARLDRSSLTGADLSEANLTGAHLDYVVATGLMLCDATLSRASLKDAKLDQVRLLDAILEDADFSRVSMKGGAFNHARAGRLTRDLAGWFQIITSGLV